MKILMVNKFHYIKGGSETYYFALKKLLEKNGHQVIDFSMKDEKNFESEYSDYFVENVEYNGKQSAMTKVKLAMNIIYSKEAKKKIEMLIEKEKPDIAHLHIFQRQISLSILDALKKYNIPVVYTAHDLQMVCPNYQMLSNGSVCEQCKGEKYYHCLKNKCIKDSFSKSALGVIEAYCNMLYKRYNKIDKIITPSKFYREKFIQFGIEPKRIVHIPNFLSSTAPAVDNIDEEYILYFGRLSREKGIKTLVEAALKTGVTLKIVGTGPLYEELQAYINSKKATNITLLGFKSGRELTNIVGNAKCVVLPSEWYENGPYSAIESLQLGRPIIGSDLGGIPELIEEGKNGYIFRHKDVEDLSACITKLMSLDDGNYQAMVKKSKEIFDTYYTESYHYEMLSAIYDSVLK